jgi:hypothetical protein
MSFVLQKVKRVFTYMFTLNFILDNLLSGSLNFSFLCSTSCLVFMQDIICLEVLLQKYRESDHSVCFAKFVEVEEVLILDRCNYELMH